MNTYSAWQEMRGGMDCTKDDPSIDGLTRGRRLTDFTVNRALFELQPGAHMVQVGFHAEGPGEDATASFGCELWAAGALTTKNCTQRPCIHPANVRVLVR